jgi:hypothetical protein
VLLRTISSNPELLNGDDVEAQEDSGAQSVRKLSLVFSPLLPSAQVKFIISKDGVFGV